QLRTVRRKDQLEDSAAEVRAIHALSGRREDQLLDQVADVVFLRGRGRASPAVELIWKIEVYGFWHRFNSPAHAFQLWKPLGVPAEPDPGSDRRRAEVPGPVPAPRAAH